MKRFVVAASMALAVFVMPASAPAIDLVDCLECGSGAPPSTQQGCSALQNDRHGGDVGRWSSSMNGDFANYEVNYTLTSPGTWNINLHFDLYDNRGVKIGNANFYQQVTVAPGTTVTVTANGSIVGVPYGGTIAMTVAGSGTFGFMSGWGQSDNFGCSVVF